MKTVAIFHHAGDRRFDREFFTVGPQAGHIIVGMASFSHFEKGKANFSEMLHIALIAFAMAYRNVFFNGTASHLFHGGAEHDGR